MAAQILNIATQYTVYNAYTVLSLGIIGNTIILLVFMQLKLFRGNRPAFFLIVESITNLLYEFLSLSLTILTSIYGDDRTGYSDVWCKIKYMLAQDFSLNTYYIICCLTADQFFSTSYYFNRRQCCTMKRTKYTAITVICMCTIHSIALGMYFQVKNLGSCSVVNPMALQYATFVFYPIVNGCLPITIASLFSLLAYRNVRRLVRRQIPIARRRLDRQMTAMIFVRVICCVCLVFPYTFFRIYVINNTVSQNQPMAYAISQLVQAVFLTFLRINSGINFYVFMLSSTRFRRQVKLLLIKTYGKQLKNWCCFKNRQVVPGNSDSNDPELGAEETS